MELTQVHGFSQQIDKLIRQNFGDNESLWNPKCFDFIFKLVEGSELLGVCTIQWCDDGYWILGDVCTSTHGKGHGKTMIKFLTELLPNDSIWADASTIQSEYILKQNGFRPTCVRPWKPTGISMLKKPVVYTSRRLGVNSIS